MPVGQSINRALHRRAPWVFAAGGLLFFLIGAGVLGSHAAFDRFGERTVGTVTGSGQLGGTSSVRYVEFEFADPSGERFSGRSSGYGGTAGETILVEYLAGWPRWNRVAGAGRKARPWLGWVTAGGAAFTLIGLHWHVLARRRRRTKERLELDGKAATGHVTELASGAVRYEFLLDETRVQGRTLGVGFVGFEELTVGCVVPILFDPGDPEINVLACE